VLPTDMSQNLLEVWVKVDARYAERIREDSQARIKTLGLLGDKYIDLASGSPAGEIVPPGGDIPPAPVTDVDRLAAAGEDVVNNIASLSHQLTTILGKMERGEGLLGKLLVDKEAGDRVSQELEQTLVALRRLAQGLDDRHGTLGRLIHDRDLGDRLAHTVETTDSLLGKMDGGEGLLPALLVDPSYKQRFEASLDHLDSAVSRLSSFTDKLEQGDGLLPKLVSDEEFGREMSRELRDLVTNLRQVAEKLNRGDGSAARVINDPTLVRAIEDVVLGVENSKFLKWMIQNRRKKGEKLRAQGSETTGGAADSSD